MEAAEKEWIQEVRETVGKLPLDRDAVNQLLYVYAIENNERERIKEEIDELVSAFSDELLLSEKPLLEAPSRLEAGGEIEIGRVFQGEKVLWNFGVSREELNQHMLITARSGAGKTTLIIRIITRLIAKGIPFLVFDFKQDYRHLIRRYPLVVIRWSDLRINPLEPPPGVGFREWKQQFLNLFGHVEGIWKGSTQYLLEAMDKAYGRKGIPTMEDVYNAIRGSNESTRKLQEYASVVETRLYGLLSKLGETINNERTLMDLERLLELPVVIELDGLGREEANILVLFFFYWIYAYRKARRQRGKLLHVLIIDEAKRVFTGSEAYSQTTAEYSGIPPADLVCDEVRDFGEGIIASDQEPTKLSNSLKANTYTKLTGFLGNGRDIDDMAEAMDLNDEEREAITKLERGEWLVKLAGRYTKPFLMRSEDFQLKKDVSDEELKASMEPRLQKLYRKFPKSRQKEDTANLELSEDAWLLLKNVNAHPFNGILSRVNDLHLSARKVEKAKQELIDEDLVKEVKISLGRRPTSFLALTDRAIKFLETQGMDTSLWRRIGHVGFQHTLYQVLIRWGFKKLGYDARVEAKLTEGRRIDVLAVGDRRIGVEVELNPNVDLRHKLEGIESLDELYIVTSRELFHEVRERLEDVPDNVKVYSIDVMLRKLRDLSIEINGRNGINPEEGKPTASPRNNWGETEIG